MQFHRGKKQNFLKRLLMQGISLSSFKGHTEEKTAVKYALCGIKMSSVFKNCTVSLESYIKTTTSHRYMYACLCKF